MRERENTTSRGREDARLRHTEAHGSSRTGGDAQAAQVLADREMLEAAGSPLPPRRGSAPPPWVHLPQSRLSSVSLSRLSLDA